MDREGTSSLIGVGMALLANTLISCGLNVERLAHIRRAHPTTTTKKSHHHHRGGAVQDEQSRLLPTTSSTPLYRSLSDPELHSSSTETTHLIVAPAPPRFPRQPSNRSNRSTRSTNRKRSDKSTTSPNHTSSSSRPRTDKGFLRSPLWIGGFVLINLGELLNFVAYGFAPTSLVAPLGMAALVANVFLAPAIVGEPFRKKDLVGIAIAIVGGATVVYASRSSDKKITPPELLHSISRPGFIVYTSLSVTTMTILAYLSQTMLGDRFVIIDLTLCALAGAFTVLSTKALSSFLNLYFLDTFRYPITYPLLIVLISTAFLQVNFINKSLQRFESRVVIPTQYMTFALSSIVGSAILYGDFKGMSGEKLLNFGFGCLISAAGVYLLTRDDSPSNPNDKSAKKKSSTNSLDSTNLIIATSDPSSTSTTTPIIITDDSTNLTSRRNLLCTSSTSPSRYLNLVVPPRLPGGGMIGRGRKLSVGLGSGYLLVGSPSGLRRDEEEEEEESDEGSAESGEEGEDGDEEERVGGDEMTRGREESRNGTRGNNKVPVER